jgi:putative transposase
MNSPYARHRLPRPYYLGQGVYFVTICAADRKKLFTDAHLVELLVTTLSDEFRKARFSVDAYCFMPDHCHVLVGSLADNCDLARAVRAFKGVSASRARKMGIRNLWQRDYYDHILRSGEGVNAVAAYIFANPVRAGLAGNPHDWPFSGSFTVEWKTLPTATHNFVPSWKRSL